MVGWQPLRKVSWTEPCLGSRLEAGPRRGIWNEGKWLYQWDDCAVTSRNQGCDHRALGNLRGHGEPGWKRLYWRTWQGHNLWKCLKSKQRSKWKIMRNQTAVFWREKLSACICERAGSQIMTNQNCFVLTKKIEFLCARTRSRINKNRTALFWREKLSVFAHAPEVE